MDELKALKRMERRQSRWWETQAITKSKILAQYLAYSEHFMDMNTRIVHNKRTGKYYVQTRKQPKVEI